MNAELTLLRHLLATCRAVRRCNPDIETSKAALNEERRLQDRIERRACAERGPKLTKLEYRGGKNTEFCLSQPVPRLSRHPLRDDVGGRRRVHSAGECAQRQPEGSV